MEINEKLKASREDLDIDQIDAAKAIGVSRKQLWRWENNRSEMGIEKLKALCLLYGVSADYILGLPKDLKWPR